MGQKVNSEQPISPPPGWEDDSLSEFLETAYRNRWATFDNKKDWYGRLAGIDACFMQIAKEWLNPINLVTPLLFLRSHAAYRAACEHAMAGQIAEIFPQLRASLEYAAYALHIDRNNDLVEVWLRRHDDHDAFNASKNHFKISEIKKTIKASNRHMADVFDELYQRTIDFGAHPNERAITGNMMISEHDGRKEFQSIYLHNDGLALTHGLKTTAQIGVCALEILQDAFKPRFELLGVRAELLKIRKGL